MSNSNRSLAGRTIRWTFTDGPTAGTTYEHTFAPEGTVIWRDVKSKENPVENSNSKTSGVPYASFEVAPNAHMVSYLSDSGYTLTVSLNLETLQCSGIASNAEEWYPSTGTVEVIR